MTVSIFTPTHDSRFLLQAYDSIKDQLFHEWIVLYNNGARPVEEIHCDPRVKAIRSENTSGWIGPLKAEACEHATGDILLELDHDDLLMPTAVEEVKNAFADPEIGFVYSNSIYSTHDFLPVKKYDAAYGWSYRVASVNGNLLDEGVSFPPSPAAVSRIWFAPNHLRAFRKSVYAAIGGYNKEMRVLDDSDLMFRMYLATRFKHIDKGLYVYRVHGENAWLQFNAEIQENVWPLYDRWIEPLVERWADVEGLRKIDIGGRFGSKPGYETVDLKDADIICDLNGKWAFEDSSVGVIRAFDIFEHLHSPLHTMKEISRVLVPGGWLLFAVPSTDGRGAFQDPTHVSFWNENSFLYYTDRRWAQYIDTPVRFQSPRLYTTEKDERQVCWTIGNLINLKDGHRPPGLILI